MTTIAYKDGVIAYDSRLTRGDLIATDECDKHTVKDGVHFVVCGPFSDEAGFISAWFGGDTDVQHNECSAFVVDGADVWMAGIDDGRVFKQPINYPAALGSGTPFATTAFDFGADAVGAVEAAKKRDINTGGEVRVFEVKDAN